MTNWRSSITVILGVHNSHCVHLKSDTTFYRKERERKHKEKIRIASETNGQPDMMMHRSRHLRADKRSDDVSSEDTSILDTRIFYFKNK